ncbi:MAG: NADAR family protein [Sporocytophaga sp.]|nr:NADAR family protein [Sporocytophaga sp.]
MTYKTAEHWMMAQKALLFGDKEAYEKILIAGSPKEAKTIGRQVLNYKEDVWIDKRFDIVVAGNLHKFSQHADLKEFLLSTKYKVIVEASPVDKI